MKGSLLKLALAAALLSGWAVAQQSSQAPDQTRPTPAVPGQTRPDQSQYPQTGTQPSMGGQSSTQSSAAISSSDLQSKIQSAFQQDSTLANTGVTVSVTDDKIHLSGTVPTNAEKDKAFSIAEQNAGGRKIEDKIKVSGNETPAPVSPR